MGFLWFSMIFACVVWVFYGISRIFVCFGWDVWGCHSAVLTVKGLELSSSAVFLRLCAAISGHSSPHCSHDQNVAHMPRAACMNSLPVFI